MFQIRLFLLLPTFILNGQFLLMQHCPQIKISPLLVKLLVKMIKGTFLYKYETVLKFNM